MTPELIHNLTIGWYAFEWILRIIALFVVPRNRKPTAGMAWLLVIFFIPAIGWPAFLLFGTSKLPRRRRAMQQTLDHQVALAIKFAQKNWKKSRSLIDARPPKKYENLARLSEQLTHLPVFAGNTIEPLADYDATIKQITADVAAAKHFVHIEYYILALDSVTEPLFDAMAAARARGVSVRVLYDGYGSHKVPRRKEMLKRLRNDGIHVQAMLPIGLPGKNYTRPDLRNHRKLVVIDGEIGFTGSLNMIQRDYHRKDSIVYDELVVRIIGPVVLQLEAVFITDWYAENGEMLTETQRDLGEQLVVKGESLAHIIPSGPGYEYENNLKVFNSVFYAAERSIVIVNPYFVPDESLIMSLTNAAQRGIKVMLLNSEAIDQAMVAHAQRSYYEQMLRAGVEVHLYKAPSLLHSKYVLVDDDIALIGSSNMDIRSFELNQELTLAVYGSDTIAKLHAITTTYLAKSKKISKKEWSRRPLRSQLLDNLARLTSSLQ